ncbi:MAG TPA: prohibitin family protein [Candidatus Mcinerneyibacteriales bacterium]|nr:prohibitin family protein [Candidatus Mcinerneyibacteriales bacterium]
MGVLFTLILTIVFIVIYVNRKRSGATDPRFRGMQNILLLAAVIFAVLTLSHFFVIIDAGEVGVQVLFGKVRERTLKAGINVVNPFVTIVKYPTRIQEHTMSIDISEGSRRGDDSVKVRTLDGLEVGVDLTVWWKIDPEKVNRVYEDLAKSTYELEMKIIRPAIRTTVRDTAAIYKMDSLYTGERKDFTNSINDTLITLLSPKSVVVDKVLVRNISLPKLVENAIEEKMKAKQQEEAMEYKKNIASREAEIKEIEARGLANAQRIINSTLSDKYLQHEAIMAYEKLANSENTTFVILPTSPTASGMPLILGK